VRWCGGLVWQCPCQRRGRRQRRRGPGAAGREGRGEGGLNWGRNDSEGALTEEGRAAALRRESVMGRAASVPEGGW
jgi:hypothetical protein